MPKVRLNPLVLEVRGSLYEDLVLKRTPEGEIIVSKKPDMSKVKWSPAQKKTRRRFAEASAYATAAKADLQVWAKYQRPAKRLKKRPRNLAISDFYKGKDLLAK